MFKQFLLYVKVTRIHVCVCVCVCVCLCVCVYLLFSIAFRISVLLFSSLILMVSFLLLTLEVFWFSLFQFI